MKFSEWDIIGKETELLNIRKNAELKAGAAGKLYTAIMYPKNPKYTFYFYVPQYVYLRSISFCDIIALEIKWRFNQSKLAKVLYQDFLRFAYQKNDLHEVYKMLSTRVLTTKINIYNDVNNLREFDESEDMEEIQVKLSHKDALKCEFILQDMYDIYKDKIFSLEEVLAIVYCSFIDQMRQGMVKNPVGRIMEYL